MPVAAEPLVEIPIAGPAVRPRNGTWIYFLGVGSEERIKIGKSGQERGKRIQQHATNVMGEKIPLTLLCEIRGKASDESAIHRYFAHCAVAESKEIFYPKPELIEYIRWLRDQWFVAMPDILDAERDAMPMVECDRWMPSPERRKTRPQGCLPGLLGPFDLGPRDMTGDDFYTDAIIIESARRVMGGFDLDPASHAVANGVVKATRIYTRADDGLLQPWSGRVWLNPPFSEKGQWTEKLLTELRNGFVVEACFLQQTRALTAQYFTPLLRAADALCIFDGRIKFWGPKAADPNDGHFVLYAGPRRDVFKKEFGEIGTVFYPGAKP